MPQKSKKLNANTQTDNMKTRIQWFNSLSECVRQQAIANTQNSLEEAPFDEKFQSLEMCLKASFDFESSPEGFNYWENVCIVHS